MKKNLAKYLSVAIAALSCAIPAFSKSLGVSSPPTDRHKRALARWNNQTEKRDEFTGVRATWYVINTGNQVACGGYYEPDARASLIIIVHMLKLIFGHIGYCFEP